MTEIDVFPGILESTPSDAVSPVADLLRVTVVGQGRQLELSLPLDVPAALLVPELVRLFDDADERPKDVAWVLAEPESEAPLDPGGTLRDAGIARDDVLQLRGRRTLAAPTLYDDVVDAAARLNQSQHPGWDQAAARRVAYLGIGLAAAAWVFLLLVDATSPRRTTLLGLTAFATVTLLVVATIFSRSAGEPRVGAALGWACLPVAAAGCWAGLSPHGTLPLAGGATAVVALSLAGYRLIGAGVAGFTAAAVLAACGATALVAESAGVTGAWAAIGLGVCATLVSAAVPRLDFSRPARPGAPLPDDAEFGGRVAWARALRSGLSAGLAVAACSGVASVVWAEPTPSWPTLTFGVVCAAALGLPRAAARTGVARAASGLPAVALAAAVAAAAIRGDAPMPMVGAAALLAVAVALAAVGAGPHPRAREALSLGSYVAFALVVPSAAWVVGSGAGWGVG
ncbi:type VII secretion integral membrane protein EccD [Mycolicibacterium sp. P1-18]|uniref:type VII secretion integral membrane protein EccD n=1 Tax=Mycolicibacterium sp. P1-18 TaxID=2024615 RepID=UPI001563AE5C|nr:type VII secretion integral membrane protein EccD [Mycolicibacterium sp. P1-18]